MWQKGSKPAPCVANPPRSLGSHLSVPLVGGDRVLVFPSIEGAIHNWKSWSKKVPTDYKVIEPWF